MEWNSKFLLEEKSNTANALVLAAPKTKHNEIKIVGLGKRIYRRAELKRAIKAAFPFDLKLEPAQHSRGTHQLWLLTISSISTGNRWLR